MSNLDMLFKVCIHNPENTFIKLFAVPPPFPIGLSKPHRAFPQNTSKKLRVIYLNIMLPLAIDPDISFFQELCHPLFCIHQHTSFASTNSRSSMVCLSYCLS